MKSIKFIVGALAGAALLLTACQEEIPAGEDQSKPVPGDFRYDAENSTADTLAFRWTQGRPSPPARHPTALKCATIRMTP